MYRFVEKIKKTKNNKKKIKYEKTIKKIKQKLKNKKKKEFMK